MLPSASSSQTVGDPLLGESGSTPMKRSDTTAYLSGDCTTLLVQGLSLHENRQELARIDHAPNRSRAASLRKFVPIALTRRRAWEHAQSIPSSAERQGTFTPATEPVRLFFPPKWAVNDKLN